MPAVFRLYGTLLPEGLQYLRPNPVYVPENDNIPDVEMSDFDKWEVSMHWYGSNPHGNPDAMVASTGVESHNMSYGTSGYYSYSFNYHMARLINFDYDETETDQTNVRLEGADIYYIIRARLDDGTRTCWVKLICDWWTPTSRGR